MSEGAEGTRVVWLQLGRGLFLSVAIKPTKSLVSAQTSISSPEDGRSLSCVGSLP
jgi:hypothetical protein